MGARVFYSTAEALDAGVAGIHQELQLVPEMSVAENLYLGHLPSRLGVVDRLRLHEAAHRALDRSPGWVLGGVSLTGGVGSIGCVIAGVLIIGVVENALNLLVAVMLDQLKNRAR